MKRLAVIAGVPVAVHVTAGDARAPETRQLRKLAPFDARPVQYHAWAAGYGSAFGDSPEEACDALAAAYGAAVVASYCGAAAVPPAALA